MLLLPEIYDNKNFTSYVTKYANKLCVLIWVLLKYRNFTHY